MLEETGEIRAVFTVICGAADVNCPSEDKLATFRILSAKSDNFVPEQIVQVALARKQLVASLKANHKVLDEPSLMDIGHYRVVEVGRDVFVGIVKVPNYVFMRDLETMLLEVREPEGRTYLNKMFSSIFQELNREGDTDFRWLTWAIVPLVEAAEGRFNPIGMGGQGDG